MRVQKNRKKIIQQKKLAKLTQSTSALETMKL